MKTLRDLLLISLLTFGVAELGARIFSKTSPVNGMPLIGRYALLPHRPAPEVMAEWVERAAKAEYAVHDEELGWVPAKSATNLVAPGIVYETNAQGVRAEKGRVFPAEPPPGKVRIVAVGDSFTHGDEVSNTETWEAQLEQLRSDVEVLNLGVGGYGTDQALLRYRRDGAPFKPQIAILGIWPENITRSLSVLRYYLDPAGGFLVKPRFLLEDGKLRLIGSPVRRDLATMTALHHQPEASELVTKYDYWYSAEYTTPQPWQHSRVVNTIASLLSYSEKRRLRTRLFSGADRHGLDLMVAIARTFSDEAKAAGARPVILILPMAELIATPGFDPAAFPLTRELRGAGLHVIDVSPAMLEGIKTIGPHRLLRPTSHYSAEGDKLVAEALATALDEDVKLALAARAAAEAARDAPADAAPAGEQPRPREVRP